jgi:small nuclear ribonucleoprotein (snRNP)-like protein
MPKNLIRIKNIESFDLQSIVNKDINIVLKSGSVFFGQIISVQNNSLTLRDKIGTKHILPLAQIEEIIQDKIHEF